MTALEKVNALYDKMDNDDTINEIHALLDAFYNITDDRGIGITAATLLYMALEYADKGREKFNSYTEELLNIVKKAEREASSAGIKDVRK